MNHRRQINRRDFLRLAATSAAGATLAACAGTDSAAPEALVPPADSRRIVFNRYERPVADGQAVYVYTDDPVVQLDLGQEFPRHERQLASLGAASLALPATDGLFGASLGWAYREYAVQRLLPSIDDQEQGAPLGDAPAQAVDRATREQQLRAAQVAAQPSDSAAPRLCLFNVLVALEWAPDPAAMRQLEWAFRRASDFLYDVTDGSMAFGQVVFGGPELMDAADIQIMASNRLNPRSWVSGLHLPIKYMPIRAGRGVWHRLNQVAIPWDEPEGYRALIHEWAHYALELRDAYLESRQFSPAGTPPGAAPYTVVVPNHGMASHSIMTTLEGTSELVPKIGSNSAKRKSEEWAAIQNRYPWLNPSPQPLDGPGQLPLPLPHFQRLGSLAGAAVTGATGLILRDFPGQLQLDRCWVYLLPGIGAGRSYPARVIAQGTLDARSAEDGFRLLGAQAGDTVVLVGQAADGRSSVFRSTIDVTVTDGQALAQVAGWRDATPAELPMIDILPAPAEPNARMAEISVRVASAGPPPDQLWVFPLGQARLEDALALGAPDRPDWISSPRHTPTLDGHVLALWGDRLLVSTFSQGGGPSSSIPGGAPPISAGSSDGNAMLFFHNDARAASSAGGPLAPRLKSAGVDGGDVDYSHVKVITTIVHGAPEQLPGGAKAHGYTFSLASNAALPLDLNPTLVMLFDTAAMSTGGDLAIHRYQNGEWLPLPTYLPPGAWFAAAPLNAQTAPGLVAAASDGPRVERYRLYLVPQS